METRRNGRNSKLALREAPERLHSAPQRSAGSPGPERPTPDVDVRVSSFEFRFPGVPRVSSSDFRFPAVPAVSARSEPVVAELRVDGKPLDRAALAELLAEDGRERIRFEARVFRNSYPNANFYRFRDEDMAAFAASFAGQPFLRNHDTQDIDSRDGTIHNSRFQDGCILQEIDLTTERGMRSFLEGQIDRFSIGWFYEGLTCSVCDNDWRNADLCPHWPGVHYTDDAGARHLCEIIFETPTGKETSAVNVPAVQGTGLLAALAHARAAGIANKEEFMKEQRQEQTRETETVPTRDIPNETQTGQAPAPAPAAAPQPTALPPTGWDVVLQRQGTEALLTASGLNAAAKDAVRAGLGDNYTPDDVNAAIERMRNALAAERDAHVVRGIEPVTAGDMQDGLDRWRQDFEWVLGVPNAPMPGPRDRSLRDLYLKLTGDYAFRGRFDPTQAQLANANSGTFAGVVLDALNRIVQEYYNHETTYRWFERLVEVLPHDGSTHDVNMVMVDGIPNLPKVDEGGAYTELTVGDSKEDMTFSKRGGYVGITVEMIRKNDIARMRTIPRGLVQACTRTRSAAIAQVFTANSGTGPTMGSDFGSRVLFHNTHNNLATTAFSLSAWQAVRTQVWKQTLPGTGQPISLWPRYCLLPIDLYDTALKLFNYGSGSNVGQPNSAGTAQEPNPYGEDRPMDMRPVPVAVPAFTDTNDWAAVVDPMELAPIKMAYANAPGGNVHPLPELYEAESPNGGLMFTHDVLPIKARDWFAWGVATVVGLAKRNV